MPGRKEAGKKLGNAEMYKEKKVLRKIVNAMYFSS